MSENALPIDPPLKLFTVTFNLSYCAESRPMADEIANQALLALLKGVSPHMVWNCQVVEATDPSIL